MHGLLSAVHELQDLCLRTLDVRTLKALHLAQFELLYNRFRLVPVKRFLMFVHELTSG